MDPRTPVAEQELLEFSYIVAHDLTASFWHVAEFSRLLVCEFGDDLTPMQRAYASRVSASTAKCQGMLDQLLVFSRVQQRVMAPVRYDATSAVTEARLGLASEISAAGAEVSIDPLGAVYGDPFLLDIVFRSLLDNAVKFSRPDAPPKIRIRPAHDGEWWRLRIGDNGPGVEPAYREKAFRMFQRLNGEDAYAGVGAGLAIARRIARRHGGDVRFIDCAEGACVELSLPRAAAPL